MSRVWSLLGMIADIIYIYRERERESTNISIGKDEH